MKILPINQTDNLYQSPNQQAFKGLWSESEIKFWEKDLTDCRREVFHYHPFQDEADEKIESVVKKYKLNTKGNHLYTPQYKYHYSRKVNVEQKLPFKESDWMQFLRNRLLMDKKTNRLIKRTITKLGLKTMP